MTKKTATVPMLMELTVHGGRWTSKSPNACADLRVRKVTNKKDWTKCNFRECSRKLSEMKVIKQRSECQEKNTLGEGHFKRYNSKGRAWDTNEGGELMVWKGAPFSPTVAYTEGRKESLETRQEKQTGARPCGILQAMLSIWISFHLN